MILYDVIIIGGGLAGCSLAIQLKRQSPDLSILIIDKRNQARPVATHKVGESTVELGTYYLRHTLGLKEYLDNNELPKYGLRFFLSPGYKNDITKRAEYGPKGPLPVKSHQLDRGKFESYLEQRAKELGAEVLMGAIVKEVMLDEEPHILQVTSNGIKEEYRARWIVDATGRGRLLQRKNRLMKSTGHKINAAWFRVKGDIDIDDFSDDSEWRGKFDPGVRRLSTVHLMDKGYWVWMIPLSSHNTSIGIVADPRIHPFEQFNSLDKAFDWLSQNEPQAHELLAPKKGDVLDFKVVKYYSHHCQQVYSNQRWAITGEAGPFLDPLYSPGTDFIAINNTIITDLIQRDLQGEDINLRKEVYEKTYLSVVDNWIPIYKDKYPLMGFTQTMVAKITWDWAYYWAFLSLLFINGGFTNLRVLKELFSSNTSTGRQLNALNQNVQNMFVAFSHYDTEDCPNAYVDPIDLPSVKYFYDDLDYQYNGNELIGKIQQNCSILEQYAAELYRRFSSIAHGTSYDIDVDPYSMDLQQNRNFAGDQCSSDHVKSFDCGIADEIEHIWLYSGVGVT